MASKDKNEFFDEKKLEDKKNKDSIKESVSRDNTDVQEEFTEIESNINISERDIFAGNEDFYKILEESSKNNKSNPQKGISKPLLKKLHISSLSLLQKILITGIVMISFLAILAILVGKKNVKNESEINTEGSIENINTNYESPIYEKGNNIEEITRNEDYAYLPEKPYSLKVAQEYYSQKNYKAAYSVYNKLYKAMPVNEELLKDYFYLKMGLCLKNILDYEEASHLLMLVSESRSPVVRTIANYHLSLIEIKRKRYLRARTRAYKTLALIKAIDFNEDWSLSFECNCNFLVAECLTRYILSLCNVGNDLPKDLWGEKERFSDPFEKMEEPELRKFLSSGTEHLNEGLLAPVIKALEEKTIYPRWSVVSYGAPFEELLSKYATSADIDIQWNLEDDLKGKSDTYIIKQKPVSIFLPSATSEQIGIITAGCAELMANQEDNQGKNILTIYNLDNYSSLNEHIDMLGKHAISLWQQFMLTFHSDERLGNVHFAMGLLQSQIEQKDNAIAEYKLVANRFSQISIAPYALFQSSELKANLRNYKGACEDLKQLIEQYPDTEIYGQAYLLYAEVTKKAGLKAEAAQLFCRLYNFGLSNKIKVASAFGAADCFYQSKGYEDAEIWLTRYLELAKGNNNNEVYLAYFLLGKTSLELGKYEQACEAFRFAITEQNTREQYIDAIKALVQGHIEQNNFIEALDTLENARSVALSQEQFVEILLLRSKIYRMLGVTETAIDILRNRTDYLLESQLNARISYELAICYIANGNLDLARKYLSEVLRISEPGQLTNEATFQLASVCLQIGQITQTISLCNQLLELNIPVTLKQNAQKLLAEAYTQEKEYEKAVLALSSQ